MQALIDFQNSEIRSGFRLDRLEVYNWGTFHGAVWSIDPAGGTSLLTGANGSGKSTLVDALITLLVPNTKRGYNLASGASRKKERDERSYVRGAYGKYKSEESQQNQTRYLRDKEDYSVLLASFTNESTGEKVVLAQLFFTQSDQLRKLYIVGPGHLSIATHFSGFDRISVLKRSLAAQGAEVFDQFNDYSKRFRRTFGLRSKKALDLFNQTVSIKAIKDLNSFVRNHMLEAADIGQTIDELRRHFEDLTHTYHAINVAKEQRDRLRPIIKLGAKYQALTGEAAQVLQALEAIPGYFARRELDLLDAALKENLDRQGATEHALYAATQELDRLRSRERSIDVAISNDQVGHQISTIARDIEVSTSERDRIRKQWDDFESTLERLSWSMPHDEPSFEQVLARGNEEKTAVTERLQQLNPERDRLVVEIESLSQEIAVRRQEVTSLRQRKSQIPSRNLEIRQKLLDALDLDAEALPFIGELLKVKDEEDVWKGAAERLLHSYALRIIVPESYYEQVNAFVNKEHLKGRIVYVRAPEGHTPPPPRSEDADLLYNKLEIKPNTPYRSWLSAELVRLYDHVCCDVHDFKHLRRALTANGLIKQNRSLHEKNDRYRVDDASRYILGWNNREKIRAIESQLEHLEQQRGRLTSRRTRIDTELQSLQEKRDLITRIERFNHYSEIDWHAIVRRIQALEDERRQLEASSDRLKQLRADLETVRGDVTLASQKVKEIESEQTLLKDRKERFTKREAKCRETLSVYALDELDQYVPVIEAEVPAPPDLDTLSDLSHRVRKSLSDRHRRVLEQKDRRGTRLVGAMKEYIHVYDVTEADATPESLPDFQRFLDTIEREDLPRHEKKFRELLQTKLLENISFFEHALFRQEEEIHEKVVVLNTSLRPISYSNHTYIQLQAKPTHDVEIREFKRLLRDVFDGRQDTLESNEATFRKINALIDRLNEDDRWTRKVTDVRYWLDFSVSERSLESDEEVKYITDSSGLSGGQKAKLAYTILASAIAYQFGLDQHHAQANSFRLVVIDEAFSKIDEDNARYAMQLFEQLGLQLLVVSPLGSTRVIEDYIAACHFVANNAEGNHSQVRNLTISEYMEEKARLLVAQGLM